MKLSFHCVFTACLLAAVQIRAQQYSDGIDINIRSGVDDAEQYKRVHDPAYARDPKRPRSFFLARVSEETTGENLVQKVDAKAVAVEVTRQLEARGFHAVQGTEKPEIVITVKYGRGWLSNPYTGGYETGAGARLSNGGTAVEVFGPIHEHFTGLVEKQARAGFEKLAIQVRAWKYPPPRDPRQQEEILWATTMYVDDPDHRDLNQIAAKMLAKGASYFDRHIGLEDEVLINTANPESHMNVGQVDVVKDPKSK